MFKLNTFTPIRLEEGRLRTIDQRLLPGREIWIDLPDLDAVAFAIVSMQVRGAPLIGITAAYGLGLAAVEFRGKGDAFMEQFEVACRKLGATRPTAVNLFWAINRMLRFAQQVKGLAPAARAAALLGEAEAIHLEDAEMCRRMGEFGAELIQDGEGVMTHCNAGALATGAWGTALGVIRCAVAQGKRIKVYARETRPLLQGARLTAWELAKDGIDVTVLPDSAGAHLMSKGTIQRVITGADRIAANGDSANKIGTYDLAIVARFHHIPLHIAAPYSTVDFTCPGGEAIPIEERSALEMTHFAGKRTIARGVPVFNPAFDVTPAHLIESIVTDAGIARAPYTQSLSQLLRGKS